MSSTNRSVPRSMRQRPAAPAVRSRSATRDPTGCYFAVYGRGALTLHALRLQLGDDTFFDILREWNERYSHGHASTGEFITLAEELSGAELDQFFDVWLFNAPSAGLELIGDLAAACDE